MSDSVRDLLVRGVAAVKAHSREEARFYCEFSTCTTGTLSHMPLLRLGLRGRTGEDPRADPS
jgi:hypothetical protein